MEHNHYLCVQTVMLVNIQTDKTFKWLETKKENIAR